MARYSVLGVDSLKSLFDRPGLEGRIQALGSLTARLGVLEEETRRLSDDSQEGLVSRRVAESSAPGCVTATPLPLAPVARHEIVVEMLACAHSIASDAMPAARAVIPEGTYRFAVGVGERTNVIQIDVTPTDLDADVIQTVADAIEAAQTGASVQIETGTGDHGDEFVRLHLLSRSTGKRSALMTADLSRNLMVLIGLAASGWAGERNGGTVTRAQDAVFFLDGVRHTAPANRVWFERERLFLALHDVGKATLSIRPDDRAIAGVMADWAQALDSVLSLAAQPHIRALLDPPSDLLGTVSRLGEVFAACGIFIRDGRHPELLPDVVARALDDMGGFFARLSAPGGLVAIVLEAAQKEIADCRRAIVALQRQADWYRQVPSPLAARRIARQAVAAYGPSALRAAPAD